MKQAFARTLALAALLALPLALLAQKDKPGKSRATSRLRIEVTAGENSKPVDGASVYVKFPDPHNGNKMREMNFRTNHEGVCHSPEIPAGRVLIQVIAEGWKTYGHWHDAVEGEQTIPVHLEKPPKWY